MKCYLSSIVIQDRATISPFGLVISCVWRRTDTSSPGGAIQPVTQGTLSLCVGISYSNILRISETHSFGDELVIQLIRLIHCRQTD